MPIKSMLKVVLISVLFTASGQAQNESPIYLRLDYMKAKSEQYPELERNYWKPVHQKRVDENLMIYWGLYSVNFPGGSNRLYDYVTISAYRNIEPLEEGFTMADKWLTMVHPNIEATSIIKQTHEAREMAWSEVFEMIASALPLKSIPGRFVMVNQMQVKPGREARYERMEMEIYLPAHRILIEEDLLVNWHLLRRFVPQGTKYGYNYLTMDVYDNLQQAAHPVPEEIWHAAHPSRDLTSFFIEIDVENMRELISGEIWELREYVISRD